MRMKWLDTSERQTDCIGEICNDVLCQLRQEDAEYDSAVRRQTEMAEQIKNTLCGTGELVLSEAERTALYHCFETYSEGFHLTELIVCYQQGYRDGLRAAVEAALLREKL